MRTISHGCQALACTAARLLLAAALPSQAPEPTTTQPAPTVVLEGRVVDLRGEGVPLANVAIATLQARDIEVANGLCDGEGFFRIGKVPPGQGWFARARVEGMCCQLGYAGEAGTPLLVTMHDAATVRGVLRDTKGSPAVGVVVCAVAAVPGEGLYELRTLVARDCEVRLLAATGPRTDVTIVAKGLPPDVRPTINLRQGIDGPQRLLRFNTYAPTLPMPWRRPVIGADGNCTLHGVPDLEYSVTMQAPGFVMSPAVATARQGSGPHALTFTATPLGSVTLSCKAVLHDQHGDPLEGVQLILRYQGASAFATSDSQGSLTFASPAAAGASARVESLDDRWVLDQTKEEGMNGWWFPEHRHEHECRIDPNAAIELRAIPACSVRGRLLTPDGRAVPFVRVQLETEQTTRGPQWQRVALATTDRDGHFYFRRLHVLTEKARTAVLSGPGPAVSGPFALDQPGTHHTAPDLTLPTPTIVMGTAVDRAGKPAAGLQVRWVTQSDGKGNIDEVLTDRLGRYRLLGVTPGPGKLEWLADEYDPIGAQPLDLEAGKALTFDFVVP
ncbi:MAG: carboxypeptidase-like regulatory domain-containing protein, partial [Planctomycetota bacterium]